MELRLLSNAELIRKVHTEFDILTSTDLERELLKRLIDQEDWQPAIDLLQENYANNPKTMTADLPALLNCVADLECVGDPAEIVKVLADHHVENIKVLREKLERADKFYDLAQEAGEAFSMLANLAENSQ